MLTRIDGHAAWLNEAALRLAGIDKDTKDPAGGRVVRGPDGAPTGVLVDNAMELASSALPASSDAELEAELLRGMNELVKLGLTTVHDCGVSPRGLEVYRRLAESGRMPLRVHAMLDGQAERDVLAAQLAKWGKSAPIGNLTVRAVKLYADGALGSRGALLFEPYSDDPGNTGLRVTAEGELRSRVLEVAKAGMQPAVHAIGDRASSEVLHAFAEAEKQVPLKPLRPRVEHLQILQPRELPLLVSTGAIASMQPTHATSDAPWAEQRLGHGTERQKGAYAWKSVLKAGAPLACGSDFPIESPDPRGGLFAAEVRRPAGADKGAPAWMPEQRLTREEALRCFTSGVAFAEHAESRRGQIKVGYDADLTAFARDVRAVDAEELPTLPIAAVVVGGKLAGK
jgi:predicted amidohydrolase YtcJ